MSLLANSDGQDSRRPTHPHLQTHQTRYRIRYQTRQQVEDEVVIAVVAGMLMKGLEWTVKGN